MRHLGKAHTAIVALLLALLTVAWLPALSTQESEGKDRQRLRLWYPKPAEEWTEALSVGGGRLGGMVFGGIPREHIQFNEDSLWTGQPHDYSNPGAYPFLKEIRRLLFDGKQREAENLALQKFMSIPLRQERYQPFGDVWIEFEGNGEIRDYERDLDIDSAVATVRYRQAGVSYSRSVFSSFPDQVLVVRLTADKPAALNFVISMTSPHEQAQTSAQADTVVLKGRVSGYSYGQDKVYHPSVLKFESRLKVHECDGKVDGAGDRLRITKAREVTLLLAAATSYVNYKDVSADPAARCAKTLAAAAGPFKDLLERHVKDHQGLFRRVSLDLGVTDEARKPTDERILDFGEGNDPDLAALLFQYGRYLLIASSRPGTQPANLQGLWNDQMAPPWESKYTTNINFEMNYWPAELANLSECHEPMFDLIRDCSITGRTTAKRHYDSRGWLIHHNTDLWRGAAPINASDHGIWVTGGAWMCQHLWWHYEFTQDREFLRNRAYPVMKQAALFFVDYLVEDPRSEERWLISGPSNSPENGGLVMGPTMDHQIIRNLFSDCIEASEILDLDADLRAKWREMKSRIAPNRVGHLGQLQEWLEDRDDPDNKHRHVSHLWGLYPGNEITREDTPELYEAARKSLEMRGDEGTGWSMGWKVNLWARLRDGDRAFKLLNNLMRLTGSSRTEYKGGGIYPNMFDAHPPFQIDGNFGAASGIAEMLFQSHRRDARGDCILELLPALPSAWPEGHIRGLCARGGFEVDISWKDGRLLEAEILSKAGRRCIVQYKDRGIEVKTEKGSTSRLDSRLMLQEL
jgi:alpha-L-fucosidase 2